MAFYSLPDIRNESVFYAFFVVGIALETFFQHLFFVLDAKDDQGKVGKKAKECVP